MHDECHSSRRSVKGKSIGTSHVKAATTAGRWQPEESSGWLSHMLYAYCNGLLALGARKVLMQDDLWAVSRCATLGHYAPLAASRKQPLSVGQKIRGWTRHACLFPFLVVVLLTAMFRSGLLTSPVLCCPAIKTEQPRSP